MSAFRFALAFPGSLKTYRVFCGGCERTTGDVNPPGHKWKLQGDGGEVLDTYHQTMPGCFWLTPTHLEMSLGRFLQEENSHASRTLSRVNATFPIVSSCDFRQISYLFPAPFSEKVTKFASDLSPSKSWGKSRASQPRSMDLQDCKNRGNKQCSVISLLRFEVSLAVFTPHCMMCI